MIWLAHKKYTPEFYAAKLDVIRRNARCSTLCMAAIAVGAAAVQILADMAYIYWL